jgi:hypothetical protein
MVAATESMASPEEADLHRWVAVQSYRKEEKGWILPGDGLHVVEKDKVREKREGTGTTLCTLYTVQLPHAE